MSIRDRIRRRLQDGVQGAFRGFMQPELLKTTTFVGGREVGAEYPRLAEGDPLDQLLPETTVTQSQRDTWAFRAADNIGGALGRIRKAMAGQPAAQEPTGHYLDPESFYPNYGQFRDRPSGLSFDTLRAMATRTPVIAAIHQTRLNQVGHFGVPQSEPTEMGFVVVPKNSEERKHPSRSTFAKVEELTEFFTFTGTKHFDRHLRRDNLEMAIRKCARDSLIFDQYCIQIVPDRAGRPAEFFTMPGHSIRLAIRDGEDGSWNLDPDEVHYVQVERGEMVEEFTARELLFEVRNPRSDLEVGGYGFSELELLVHVVTGMLWAEQYNYRFFSCIPGTCVVKARTGLETISSLVGRDFEIWNGRAWRPARAMETGRKSLVRTKLWNGLELGTSPEHRFLAIPKESLDGVPDWVEQRELAPGDFVLVDHELSDPPESLDALRVGCDYLTDGINPESKDFTPTKELLRDVRFWELLGFALGDGHWPDLSEHSFPLQIFPHYDKDAELFDRFLAVCSRHGIHAHRTTTNKTVKRSDGEYGYPAIHIGHDTFVRWLYEIGFHPSCDGKVIPNVLYRQPASVREAFLRGLFSADGCTRTHQTGYRTPTLGCFDERLQQDVLTCLWSVGVAANLVGQGWGIRHGLITAQDVRAFAARIGYLQDYKNAGLVREDKSADRWDQLHPAVSRQVGRMLVETGRVKELSTGDRSLAYQARRGACRMSRPKARELCRALDVGEPMSLSYCQVPIDVLDTEPVGTERMYDVEVFDDEHIFLANHVAVHNSGSTIKGILNVKGFLTRQQLRAFRREWFALISGVHNAWRTPIFNAEDVQFIPMHASNKDMEFTEWLHYLLKLSCGIYQIDPSEINFHFGNEGQTTQVFESSNEAKARLSRDRGLRPLVVKLQGSLNTIMQGIDPNFEIQLAGLDAKSEEQKAQLAEQLTRSAWTINEARDRLYGMPPLDTGDTLRSGEWLAYIEQLGTLAEQLNGGTGESDPGEASDGNGSLSKKSSAGVPGGTG